MVVETGVGVTVTPDVGSPVIVGLFVFSGVGVVVGVITGVSPDGELVISGVGVLVSVGIGVGVSVGLKSVEPPARAG